MKTTRRDTSCHLPASAPGGLSGVSPFDTVGTHVVMVYDVCTSSATDRPSHPRGVRDHRLLLCALDRAAGVMGDRDRRRLYPGGPDAGTRAPGAAGPRTGGARDDAPGRAHAMTEYDVTTTVSDHVQQKVLTRNPRRSRARDRRLTPERWFARSPPRPGVVESHREIRRGRCPPASPRDRRRGCHQTGARGHPSGIDGRPYSRPG